MELGFMYLLESFFLWDLFNQMKAKCYYYVGFYAELKCKFNAKEFYE